jgi:membrane protein
MARSAFAGIHRSGIYQRSWKDFFRDLKREMGEDQVSNGAAALAHFLMLAIFPAMIFLLSLLPFLPIEHLQDAIMDLLRQMLPGDAANAFVGAVQEVATQKSTSLLSFGALLTLWAASSGMQAVMEQLNLTYDVQGSRSYVKKRGLAMLLTIGFGGLVIVAFGMVVLGGQLQEWMIANLSISGPVVIFFAIARWVIIGGALALAFALLYYFGPDVEQDFHYVTPGSLIAVLLLIAASLGFKAYVDHFGNYAATYGSIGAVIVLMLWLYITGFVILIGSEINALIEHYSPEGKSLGHKRLPPEHRPRATPLPA